MTAGIRSLGMTLEYSTQVPPTAGTTWNLVPEVKSVTPNRVAAARIPFTHLQSTQVENKLGLRDLGTYDISANFISQHVATAAIIALDVNKEARWWRITYAKQLPASASGAKELFAGFVDIAGPTPGDVESPVNFDFTVQIVSDYTYTAEV